MGPAKPAVSEEPRSQPDPEAPRPPEAMNKPAPAEFDPSVLETASAPMRWRLSHMMYLVAGAAIFLWFALLATDSVVMGSLFVIGGFVFIFSAVMGAGLILARRRSTRQDSLLWVVAIAAEEGMPLAPAVAVFAEQYRGKTRRRLSELASQLESGTSIAEALEQSRHLVSRDAVLLAWIGQTAGRLSRALKMAATSRSGQLPIWTAITARLSYILALMLVMQFITAFIMYFIIPKFEAIFHDFNVSLPQITVLVIEVSHLFAKYALVTIWIPVVEVALLLFMPLSFLAWGNFAVPLFDRVFDRRHAALVLRSLALIVDADKPIATGLATLAEHYPTGRIRRRLARVESQVKDGADWIESLVRNHVIRPADGDVLVSAAEVGNLGWALSELAEAAERRLANRFQVVVQSLFPLVVVMLGMVVFIMAMAYFVPLVELITELTRQ